MPSTQNAANIHEYRSVPVSSLVESASTGLTQSILEFWRSVGLHSAIFGEAPIHHRINIQTYFA